MKRVSFIGWLFAMSKRLLRKPSFAFILLLIPVAALFMSGLGKGDGAVRVAVFSEDGTADEFVTLESVVTFTRAESAEKAGELVLSGKADEAWIFESDTADRINEYASGKRTPFIRVLVREDNVWLGLSREKIINVVYPRLSRALYEKAVHDELGDIYTGDELAGAYENRIVPDSMIVFETVDGEAAEYGGNYLAAPLRGMLALLVTLCAMAATLYGMTDDEKGALCLLTATEKLVPLASSALAGALAGEVAMFVSLAAAGSLSASEAPREIISALVLAAAATAFSVLSATVFRKSGAMAAFLPVYLAFSVAVCPIFIDLGAPTFLKFLFPTYIYICALGNRIFVLFGLIFAAVALLLSLFIRKLRKYF